MRIDSSNIGMESRRNYRLYTEKSINIRVIPGSAGRLDNNKSSVQVSQNRINNNGSRELTSRQNQGSLQDKLKEMNSNSGIRRMSGLKGERNTLNKVRESCLKYLADIFFREANGWNNNYSIFELTGWQGNNQTSVNTVYYEQELYFKETEDTAFSTTGTVKCADGREISFNLEMQMSRSFSTYYKENYISVQQNMCDPLVINLDGDIAQLDDQKFFFDIDADGVEDEISTLGKGSGYLALDKNNDGIINNGNELFGAKSGNGFADLAAYDSDGNGWIDENDAIWKKLLIWTKDEEGNDKCYSLKEKDVGAICLSNASTDFSLNSTDNTVNGRIRRTGIFLYENGNVGTVQHLDIAR